jgi:hypothetical protein
MTTPINDALEALTLAAQCGGELDLEQYRQALLALQNAVNAVREHDRNLNATEEPPTGDDYERILDILGLKTGKGGEGAQ